MKTQFLQRLERAHWHMLKVWEAIAKDEPAPASKQALIDARQKWCTAHAALLARQADIAAKRDAGEICFEVFVPECKGYALKHITRTPNRLITETLWRGWDGVFAPSKDAKPYVETRLYRTLEEDFKRFQEVAP